MKNDVSQFKQLQNSVDRLQTQTELLGHENKRLKAEIAEHKQSIADLCNTISYQTAQMGMLKIVNEQLRKKLSTVYDQVNREWFAIEESISQSMQSLKRGLRNAVVINEDD